MCVCVCDKLDKMYMSQRSVLNRSFFPRRNLCMCHRTNKERLAGRKTAHFGEDLWKVCNLHMLIKWWACLQKKNWPTYFIGLLWKIKMFPLSSETKIFVDINVELFLGRLKNDNILLIGFLYMFSSSAVI